MTRTTPVEVRRHADAHLEPALVVSPVGDPARDFVIDHVNPAAVVVLGDPVPVGRHLYTVFPWLPALDLHDVYLDVLRTGVPVTRIGVPYPQDERGGPWLGRFDLRISRHGDQLVVAWRDTSTDRLLEQSRRELVHERQRASLLQAAYLPRQLPGVPGIALAWRYVSADAGAAVGGDWYDAIDVDGGVLLSIGDVAGHGLPAVETMAVARIAARAYAELDPDPSVLLGRLGHYVVQHARRNGVSVLATTLAATIRVEDGCLTWASAGHLAPLVVDAAGARLLEGRNGRPLGVASDPPPTNQVLLAPGSTVVLYTDGLIERRDEPIDAGLARLVDVASSVPPSAGTEALCDHLIAALHDRRHHDDVCVVAAHLG